MIFKSYEEVVEFIELIPSKVRRENVYIDTDKGVYKVCNSVSIDHELCKVISRYEWCKGMYPVYISSYDKIFNREVDVYSKYSKKDADNILKVVACEHLLYTAINTVLDNIYITRRSIPADQSLDICFTVAGRVKNFTIKSLIVKDITIDIRKELPELMKIPSWWERKFNRNFKCSFGYWFQHWKEFQYVGWENDCWRPSDLLHDIMKPWMNLILPYHITQYIHRSLASHHDEYIFCNINKRKRIIDEFASWISTVKHYEGDPVENLLDTGYINNDDINKYIK